MPNSWPKLFPLIRPNLTKFSSHRINRSSKVRSEVQSTQISHYTQQKPRSTRPMGKPSSTWLRPTYSQRTVAFAIHLITLSCEPIPSHRHPQISRLRRHRRRGREVCASETHFLQFIAINHQFASENWNITNKGGIKTTIAKLTNLI